MVKRREAFWQDWRRIDAAFEVLVVKVAPNMLDLGRLEPFFMPRYVVCVLRCRRAQATFPVYASSCGGVDRRPNQTSDFDERCLLFDRLSHRLRTHTHSKTWYSALRRMENASLEGRRWVNRAARTAVSTLRRHRHPLKLLRCLTGIPRTGRGTPQA